MATLKLWLFKEILERVSRFFMSLREIKQCFMLFFSYCLNFVSMIELPEDGGFTFLIGIVAVIVTSLCSYDFFLESSKHVKTCYLFHSKSPKDFLHPVKCQKVNLLQICNPWRIGALTNELLGVGEEKSC